VPDSGLSMGEAWAASWPIRNQNSDRSRINHAANNTHYDAVGRHHSEGEQRGPRTETKLHRKPSTGKKIRSIANHPRTELTDSFI
jgi:hypothetical protein